MSIQSHKTMIIMLFHSLTIDVNEGIIPENFDFMLCKTNNEGEIADVTYKDV